MNIEEELKIIKLKRGEIITNFAYMELMMSELIAFHYTESHEKAKSFREDILEHEYFNFGLRKSMFKLVMEKHYSDKNFAFGKFTRMGRIRNVIAHATIESKHFFDGTHYKVVEGPFYRHAGGNSDCQALHAEYNELKDELEPVLKEMVNSQTVEFSKIISKEDGEKIS